MHIVIRLPRLIQAYWEALGRSVNGRRRKKRHRAQLALEVKRLRCCLLQADRQQPITPFERRRITATAQNCKHIDMALGMQLDALAHYSRAGALHDLAVMELQLGGVKMPAGPLEQGVDYVAALIADLFLPEQPQSRRIA